MQTTITNKGHILTINFNSPKPPNLTDRTYLWSEIILIQSTIPNSTNNIIGSTIIIEPCTKKLRIVVGSELWQLRNDSELIQIRLLHVSKLINPNNTNKPLFYDSIWIGSLKLPNSPKKFPNKLWEYKDFPWSIWFDTLPWYNEDLGTETQMANEMYSWLLQQQYSDDLRSNLKLWVKKIAKSLNYITVMNFHTYLEDPGNGAHYYPEHSNGGDCKDYSSYMMRSFHICKKLCNVLNNPWKNLFSNNAKLYYHGTRVGKISEGDHINLIYTLDNQKFILDPIVEKVYRYNINSKRTTEYIKKSLYCSSIEDGVQGITSDWEFRRVSKRLC